MKNVNSVNNTYFLFYAVTFFGSALTAVSSFFMIEQLSGSLASLGVALAAKTAFLAVASPIVARLIGRYPLSHGFFASQLFGSILLLPLFVGIMYQHANLFVAGIIVGGLPGLILNMAGTSYLRLTTGRDATQFRENQGKLQLITGVCFTVSAILAPLLLKYFNFSAILLIDLLSYSFGSIYLLRHRYQLKKVDLQDSPVSPAEASKSERRYFSLPVILTGVALTSIYLLKGLPPLIAGSGELTSSIQVDVFWRRSLWALEAAAGIGSGYLYKRYHGSLKRFHIYQIGLLNSGVLAVLLIPGFIPLAVTIFLLSVMMTLTFMKVRDDFISTYTTKADVAWAIGFTSLVTNVVLTLSPILIGMFISEIGTNKAVAVALGLQILSAIALRLGRRSILPDSPNLTKKITKIGNTAIISFLLVVCCLLSVVLHSYERKRAERQMTIWAQSISKSIIPQLVDGDYVPIFGKLNMLRQTDLFSEFAIYDSQKQIIASYTKDEKSIRPLAPIMDEVGSVWGYYSYAPNVLYWWYSLALVLPIVFISIISIGLLARLLFFRQVRAEISGVSHFIEAIESYSVAISKTPSSSAITPFVLKSRNLDELDRIGSVVEELALQIREKQRQIFENEVEIARSQQVAEISEQVAHDIRSPLAALNVAVASLSTVDTPTANLITSATRRINEIANDLLSRARSASNAQDSRTEVILLADVLFALIEEKRLQFANHPGVTIDYQVDGGSGQHVNVNRNNLVRALSNLINNAVEALPNQQGTVCVRLDTLDDNMVVQVNDTGSGISPQVLERLGERGFSFGKAGINSGSGLGLYQAKKAVQDCNGSFSIASDIGKGTQITIKLPLYPLTKVS